MTESDPLTDVVTLMQPRAVFANPVSGKGRWAVRFAAYGRPSFCTLLEGSCCLAVDGHDAVMLRAGDFVFLPATPPFTLSSADPPPPVHHDPDTIGGDGGEVRYGEPAGPPEMRSLGGAFLFGTPDPSLLVSLLPGVVHVQGSTRLAQLVHWMNDEFAAPAPGRAFMLSHLAAMMLLEAMRSSASGGAPPGLLRGLGDARLAPALQALHARVDHPWTVAMLADRAALSRSAFFDRFTLAVGVPPMAYLLAWRMEVAKDLLRREGAAIADVAQRVGYASTSTFSTAFSRHVGQAPRHYARGP